MNPSGDVTGFGPLNEGIQSAIDEAARSAARNVVPALSADMVHRLQTQVVPALLRDEQMQRNIGSAAGASAVQEAKPYIWVATGALLLIASIQLFRYVGKGSARANPTSCSECSGGMRRRRRRGSR